MDKKQSRKIQYSKMVIRESLIELLKTRSILNITVKDICDRADICRSTFYDHYKDQYDLLRQIEEETLAYFEEMLDKYKDKHSKKEIAQMLEEILTYIANNGNSMQVLLSENGDVVFQKKWFHHYINHELVTRYLTDKQQDDEVKAYHSVFIVNGSISVIQHWLKNNMSIPVPQLTKMLLQWNK